MTLGNPDSLSEGLTGFFGDKRERNGDSEKNNQCDSESFAESRIDDRDDESERGERNEYHHGMNDQRVDGQPRNDVEK